MGRKKVERTPSEEAQHKAELKERKAERDKKRKAEQTDEQREAVKAKKRKDISDNRQNLSEAEKAARAETERLRIAAQRAQETEAEKDARVETERVRIAAQRAQETEPEKAERAEADRQRLAAQRSQETEAEKTDRVETERLRIAAQRAQQTDEQARAERERDKLRKQFQRKRETKLRAAGYEIDDNGEAHYGGPLNFICTHCGAKHFKSEKVSNKGLSFSGCCQHGTIKVEIPDYPEELKPLFDLPEFRKDIRVLNNAHSFGSFNADVVNFGVNRPGPYAFVVQGQVYYQINTALQNQPDQPKSHGQLYILDPDEAAENRLNAFNKLNPDIVKKLSTVLHEINEHAKAFQMLHE